MDEEQIREIVREELAEQNGGGEQGGEQPRVGRRGVLGSLAAAAGLGAAGVYAVQPVAAAGHSGQLGTPSKLQRIWAETIRDSNDDAMLDFTGGNVDFRNNSATNLASLSTTSLNGGGPVSDGDGTERQVWIIANGASDPAGADPEDIIFEEQ